MRHLGDLQRVARRPPPSAAHRLQPASPVPALALPELTITAAALPPLARKRGAVELDRRRGELVLREHGGAGHRLAILGREQRHVETRAA